MTLSIDLDATGLAAGLADAGAEINRLAREEIAPAAALVETAFAGAARGIERELARAARSGEFSIRRLGRAVAGDLISSGLDAFVRQPIERALGGLLAAPFGGGRAEGGLVAPGQSFLVGERGPELFTPSTVGRVSIAASAPMSVSIVLTGVTNPESFRQSETQIAAGLQRALARGARNS